MFNPKFEGWIFPVITTLENESYTMEFVYTVDWTQVRVQLTNPNYMAYTHPSRGYNKSVPIQEGIKLRLPYYEWAHHFSTRMDSRALAREPELSDPWGSFSQRHFPEHCNHYNLSGFPTHPYRILVPDPETYPDNMQELCSAWTKETGLNFMEKLLERVPADGYGGQLGQPPGELVMILNRKSYVWGGQLLNKKQCPNNWWETQRGSCCLCPIPTTTTSTTSSTTTLTSTTITTITRVAGSVDIYAEFILKFGGSDSCEDFLAELGNASSAEEEVAGVARKLLPRVASDAIEVKYVACVDFRRLAEIGIELDSSRTRGRHLDEAESFDFKVSMEVYTDNMDHASNITDTLRSESFEEAFAGDLAQYLPAGDRSGKVIITPVLRVSTWGDNATSWEIMETTSTTTTTIITYRLWSDASQWPGGKLPEEGDTVIIHGGDEVMLDIRTPIFYWVIIHGKLLVSPSVSTTLQAYSVLVWGNFEIGTPEFPIPPHVHHETRLHGAWNETTVVLAEGLQLINKVIVVMGNLTAVSSKVPWTRISVTAEEKASQISVQGDASGWPSEAEVSIAPTEYPSPPLKTEAEVRRIVGTPKYNASTDTTEIQLDRLLDHRHFGGDVLAGGKVKSHWGDSLHLAAPVALLSRNVVFRTCGAPTYKWWSDGSVSLLHMDENCTRENPDPERNNGHGAAMWVVHSDGTMPGGQANLIGAQFLNMGKLEQEHAALHFARMGTEESRKKRRNVVVNDRPQHVEGCVFAHSEGPAVEISWASKLDFEANIMHRSFRSGVYLHEPTRGGGIRIVNNLATEVLRNPRESQWAKGYVRPFASFYMQVQPRVLEGNVAAGSTDSGFFITPAKSNTCRLHGSDGPSPTRAVMNEAIGCMIGFFILAGKAWCVEMRGGIAWKNSHLGITSVDQRSMLQLEDLALADNHIGVGMAFYRPKTDMKHRAWAHNLTILGSTDASVCSKSVDCRAINAGDLQGRGCNSVLGNTMRRAGIITYTSTSKHKLCKSSWNADLQTCRSSDGLCAVPWENMHKASGGRYAESFWSSITFGSFQREDCGRQSAAVAWNPTGYTDPYPKFFYDVRWLTSAAEDARIGLDRWAPTEDGLLHVVLHDKDGSLLGLNEPNSVALPLVSVGSTTSLCQQRVGHFACTRSRFRYLKWEDPQPDKFGRNIGFMKLHRLSDGRQTWSRGQEKKCMDDPELDRGWTLRMQDQYNLTLFASPPKHHRLFLFSDNPEDGIRLAIFLTQPFRLSVFYKGQKLGDSYDTALGCGDTRKCPGGPRLPTFQDRHGTHAFHPQWRRWYITLRGAEGGRLGLHPIILRLTQVVQLSLTAAVTLEEFDGPKFIQNLATLLVIPLHRIKIVSVQQVTPPSASPLRRLSEGNASNASSGGAGLSIETQILEDEPEGIDPTLFAEEEENETFGGSADSGAENKTLEEEEEEVDNGEASSEGGANESGASGATGFSTGNLAELQATADRLVQAVSSGSMVTALGFEVEGLEVKVSDPEMTTTSTTTSTTSTKSTTSNAPTPSTATTTTSTTTLGGQAAVITARVLMQLELDSSLGGQGDCPSTVQALRADGTFDERVRVAASGNIPGVESKSVQIMSMQCVASRRLDVQAQHRNLASTISLESVLHIVTVTGNAQNVRQSLGSQAFTTAFAAGISEHPTVQSTTVSALEELTELQRTKLEVPADSDNYVVWRWLIGFSVFIVAMLALVGGLFVCRTCRRQEAQVKPMPPSLDKSQVPEPQESSSSEATPQTSSAWKGWLEKSPPQPPRKPKDCFMTPIEYIPDIGEVGESPTALRSGSSGRRSLVSRQGTNLHVTDVGLRASWSMSSFTLASGPSTTREPIPRVPSMATLT